MPKTKPTVDDDRTKKPEAVKQSDDPRTPPHYHRSARPPRSAGERCARQGDATRSTNPTRPRPPGERNQTHKQRQPLIATRNKPSDRQAKQDTDRQAKQRVRPSGKAGIGATSPAAGRPRSEAGSRSASQTAGRSATPRRRQSATSGATKARATTSAGPATPTTRPTRSPARSRRRQSPAGCSAATAAATAERRQQGHGK